MENELKKEIQSDHDLLIRVDANLTNLTIDVKNLSNGLDGKLLDHEVRIRDVEKSVTKITTWGTVGVILLGVAEFLLLKFLK